MRGVDSRPLSVVLLLGLLHFGLAMVSGLRDSARRRACTAYYRRPDVRNEITLHGAASGAASTAIDDTLGATSKQARATDSQRDTLSASSVL